MKLIYIYNINIIPKIILFFNVKIKFSNERKLAFVEGVSWVVFGERNEEIGWEYLIIAL